MAQKRLLVRGWGLGPAGRGSATFARAAAVAHQLQGFAILGTTAVSCVSVSWKSMNQQLTAMTLFPRNIH